MLSQRLTLRDCYSTPTELWRQLGAELQFYQNVVRAHSSFLRRIQSYGVKMFKFALWRMVTGPVRV